MRRCSRLDRVTTPTTCATSGAQRSPPSAPPHRPARRSPARCSRRCSSPAAAPPAMTSHAGWPPDQHLVMDKGPAGRATRADGRRRQAQLPARRLRRRHDLRRRRRRRDLGRLPPLRLAGAPDGRDPRGQRQELHLRQRHRQLRVDRHQPGDGRARARGLRRDPLRKPAPIVYTSHHALPHYKLDGCKHVSFYSVGY